MNGAADAVWNRLGKERKLNDEIRAAILEAFGTRGEKALAAIDGGRIRKYLDFFVVEGKTASYVVEEDFCTCGDFLYRGRTCWHLLAVRIARLTGNFEVVESWYQDVIKEKAGK